MSVFRVGIFVNKAITFVFGILKTFQFLRLDALFGQLKLTFHEQQGKIFAQSTIRIVLQSVLGGDDTCLIIVSAIVSVTKVSAQVVIQLCRVQLFLYQFVL